MQFRADSQVCTIQRLSGEMRDHHRIAHSNRPACREIDVTPQAHVFVRRSRIPIDKGNPKVLGAGNEHLNREHVRPVLVNERRCIQFKYPVGACDILRIREFFPIQPNICPVINPVEMQPDFSAPEILWQLEFSSIPPRACVWTPTRHVQIGIHLSDWIVHTGKLAQVLAEVDVAELSIGHLRGQYGRWNCCFVPLDW